MALPGVPYRPMLSGEGTRVFVAIETGEALRAWLEEVLDLLSRRHPQVAWVPPRNVHLTLRFLGGIETARIGGVLEALGRAVARRPPPSGLRLEVEGPGAFGPRSAPRVLWLGLRPSTGLEYVTVLQSGIEAELKGLREQGSLDLESGRRPWRPHLTLGRNRRGVALDGWRECFDTMPAPPAIMVNEVRLLWSELTPRGSIYRAIGNVKLHE